MLPIEYHMETRPPTWNEVENTVKLEKHQPQGLMAFHMEEHPRHPEIPLEADESGVGEWRKAGS